MSSQRRIYVTKPGMPSLNDYSKMLESAWESAILTNDGPLHKQFAGKVSEYLRADNLELFVNGHIALDFAIKALNLKGEVITTPFTFASTVHAITMNGLTPIFCDIRPDTYNIDESKIESKITENTCAILPVHVYGTPCDCSKINEIAVKHRLKVIYDAAHAFGVTKHGRSIACEGDVSMYSFHATKVFNTVEGGALTFRDAELRKKFRNLRNFGIENVETVSMPGMNGKMNELCAAMGLCNLSRVERDIAERRSIAMRYMDNISQHPGIKLLDYLSLEREGIKPNYGYFPIFINKEVAGFSRDELHDQFAAHGIYTRKYFWPLVTDYQCYSEKYYDCFIPVARQVSAEVLALPIYPGLDIMDVDRICGLIHQMRTKCNVALLDEKGEFIDNHHTL